MYWDDTGALKFDKSSDLITTPFFGDNDITHELVSLAFNNGIGEDCILAGTEELADLYKYNPTGAGTTIYLWAHGNRSRAAIGVGGSQKSPDQVLTFLEDAGLRKGHTGDICIWSCWGAFSTGSAMPLPCGVARAATAACPCGGRGSSREPWSSSIR